MLPTPRKPGVRGAGVQPMPMHPNHVPALVPARGNALSDGGGEDLTAICAFGLTNDAAADLNSGSEHQNGFPSVGKAKTCICESLDAIAMSF